MEHLTTTWGDIETFEVRRAGRICEAASAHLYITARELAEEAGVDPQRLLNTRSACPGSDYITTKEHLELRAAWHRLDIGHHASMARTWHCSWRHPYGDVETTYEWMSMSSGEVIRIEGEAGHPLEIPGTNPLESHRSRLHDALLAIGHKPGGNYTIKLGWAAENYLRSLGSDDTEEEF